MNKKMQFKKKNSPIFFAKATLTIVEVSIASGAIAGKTYSGKTFASLLGRSFTIHKHCVNVSNALTRTRGIESLAR